MAKNERKFNQRTSDCAQEMIRQVNEEIQFSKREVQMLRQEKEQLENVLSHKSTEVRKNLQIEAER